MNEAEARPVLLARTYETSQAGRVVWSDADRLWASRAATAAVGEKAPLDVFIARRAQLVIERLAANDRAVPRVLRTVTWRPWVAPLLAALAFVAGLATETIGPDQRINILAPPLLALMAWNVGVYAVMLARAMLALIAPSPRMGPLTRTLARLARGLPRALPDTVSPANSAPTAIFLRDWARAGAPLTAARVRHMLHTAAITLALGALAGLYLRGLMFDYRAGWESTFLGPGAVHALLSFILAPASALTGIAVPDAAHVATLRLPESTGENAAPWIHLYATLVACLVIVPRALLALLDRWLVRHYTVRFPLALDDPYFVHLARLQRGEAAIAYVVPYGHTPSAQAALGLGALIGRVYGPTARVELASAVPLGAEDAPALALPGAPPALAAALFATTATPEREHHGTLVAAVASRLPRSVPLVAIADESAFLRRFGDNAARVNERRAAWRSLLAQFRCEVAFVDLEHPDLRDAEAQLQTALDSARAHHDADAAA